MPSYFKPMDADVIVIGAGIAGLACAARLRGAGLRVTVLEARHRAGGRLHTVSLDAGPGKQYAVDLGGAWIHGIGSAGTPNQLYSLACELNLGCRPTDYNDAAVYTSDGVRLPDSVVADIEQLYYTFEQHLQALLHAPDPRLALMPIQAAMEAFSRSCGLNAAQAAQLAFAVSNHMEHYWAGEARTMGVAALDEVVLPGGDVVLAEGYGGLVGRLAAGLDLRLGHEVLAVQYGSGCDGVAADGSGGGVTVTARVAAPRPGEDGGGGGAGGAGGGMIVRLAARAAVVTLPLGVLRSGAVEFAPPLAAVDPAKAAAIAQLGTATYNKVIMVYDSADVFWDDTAFLYRIPAPWEQGRWSYFLNLNKVCGAPILVAFNLGEAAVQLEGVSDDEAVEGALRALAELYGADRVRRPRRAVVTRWGSDPYSRMSYTYVPAGLTGAAFDDVARPLLGRLFFAGEAAHRRHYGTAHGAHDSGHLAAAAILRQLAADAAAPPPPPPAPRSMPVRLAWPVGRGAALPAPPRVARAQARAARWWWAKQQQQIGGSRHGGGAAAADASDELVSLTGALCLAPTGGMTVAAAAVLDDHRDGEGADGESCGGGGWGRAATAGEGRPAEAAGAAAPPAGAGAAAAAAAAAVAAGEGAGGFEQAGRSRL